jgi:hypothetical protein
MLSKQAGVALLALWLLFFGQFFPTSINTVIQVPLIVLHEAIFALMALVLLMHQRDAGQGARVLTAALIISILVLATVFSPFSTLTPGTFAGFVAFTSMYTLSLTNLGETGNPKTFRRILGVSDVVTLTLAVAIIIGIGPVRDFMVSFYSFAYEELVMRMIGSKGKPVVTFGSHSIAGFFFFIFFYLNLQTRRAGGSRLFLVAALAFALLELFLISVTGILFLGLAGLVLIFYLTEGRAALRYSLLGLIGVSIIGGYAILVQLGVVDALTTILTAQDNGLIGRYSRTGTLLPNIHYLMEHPFRPVGVTYFSGFHYGDSGPIEYLLRGSVPLVIAVYFGLYRFLKDNLSDRRHLAPLLGAVFLFETGYTVLTYHRLVYLLTFAILYLDCVASGQPRLVRASG